MCDMWIRYTLDSCLVAQAASATETSNSKPIMVVFSAGESSSSLCLCEERSDEAISWRAMRLPHTFPVLAMTGRGRWLTRIIQRAEFYSKSGFSII